MRETLSRAKRKATGVTLLLWRGRLAHTSQKDARARRPRHTSRAHAANRFDFWMIADSLDPGLSRRRAFGAVLAPPSAAWNSATGPDFVDPTRNVAEWAVSKGAIGSGATLRQNIDAALVLLAADPYLIGSELIPWVRAGFAPQNPALDGTAHDAGTIGAVPYAGA